MSDPHAIASRCTLLAAAITVVITLSACDRRPSDPTRPTVAAEQPAAPAQPSASAPDTQR